MLFDFSPILTYTHSVCKKEFDIQRKSFWLTLFIAEAFDAPKGFSAEHEINRDIEGVPPRMKLIEILKGFSCTA